MLSKAVVAIEEEKESVCSESDEEKLSPKILQKLEGKIVIAED